MNYIVAKSLYICECQKKKPSKLTSKKSRHFGTCEHANCAIIAKMYWLDTRVVNRAGLFRWGSGLTSMKTLGLFRARYYAC